MPERDRLHQTLIHAKRPRDRPRILGNLERMGEPRAVMIPFGLQKYLCFIFQAPERLAMYDPVSVSLEHRTYITLWFRIIASDGIFAERRIGAERSMFHLFQTFPNCHVMPSFLIHRLPKTASIYIILRLRHISFIFYKIYADNKIRKPLFAKFPYFLCTAIYFSFCIKPTLSNPVPACKYLRGSFCSSSYLLR